MADRVPGPSAADEDFGGARELLDEFLFFSVGVDGIVVNDERAHDASLPCRCVEITKANGEKSSLCFHSGLVGTLTKQQEEDLCRTRVPLERPEGIRRRVAVFEAASERCKGLEVEKRLECMAVSLKRDGVKWGYGGP